MASYDFTTSGHVKFKKNDNFVTYSSIVICSFSTKESNVLSKKTMSFFCLSFSSSNQSPFFSHVLVLTVCNILYFSHFPLATFCWNQTILPYKESRGRESVLQTLCGFVLYIYWFRIWKWELLYKNIRHSHRKKLVLPFFIPLCVWVGSSGGTELARIFMRH